MILTARIAEDDLQPFDVLRRKHFPAERNFLRAHLTMFHRLPGEYVGKIIENLRSISTRQSAFTAHVRGVRHLGAGVAFTIESAELTSVRDVLRNGFVQWLGSQDMQKWQPHITIQNKASRTEAETLYREMSDGFQPLDIRIVGLDLWRYLDGPWASETSILFE